MLSRADSWTYTWSRLWASRVAEGDPEPVGEFVVASVVSVVDGVLVGAERPAPPARGEGELPQADRAAATETQTTIAVNLPARIVTLRLFGGPELIPWASAVETVHLRLSVSDASPGSAGACEP